MKLKFKKNPVPKFHRFTFNKKFRKVYNPFKINFNKMIYANYLTNIGEPIDEYVKKDR